MSDTNTERLTDGGGGRIVVPKSKAELDSEKAAEGLVSIGVTVSEPAVGQRIAEPLRIRMTQPAGEPEEEVLPEGTHLMDLGNGRTARVTDGAPQPADYYRTAYNTLRERINDPVKGVNVHFAEHLLRGLPE